MELASRNLYPPTVDSYQAAFDANQDYCRMYFSLSKFSASTADIGAIQLSITKQETGSSVVNKNKSSVNNGIFTSTGVIIINDDSKYFYNSVSDEDNLYYIDIYGDWLIGGQWEEGSIYKVQIRLSEEPYENPSENNTQATWLANNTQIFSEWSTYTVLKATGTSTITFSNPSWSSSDISETSSNTVTTIQYSSSTLEIQGEYSNTDTNETLNSYEISLYNEDDDTLLATSGTCYQNKTVESNKIYYLCSYELVKDVKYNIHIHFMTINKYENEYIIPITANWYAIDLCQVSVISIENDINNIMKKYTTLEDENEEGRAVLKLYSSKSSPMNSNFIIRRADSKDNFKKWNDIKIINCVNKSPNNLDIFYDYTIESGVYYKYGIQTFNNNIRGVFNENDAIIIRRDFEYSYLLGENFKQLKLKFDNTMENFTPNVSDTKTDTIGSKYPFITRNGNMDYRSFPVNGLISFHMDDQHTFVQRKDLFINDTVLKKYNEDAENMFEGYVNPTTNTQTDTEILRIDSHGENVLAPKYVYSKGGNGVNSIYDYDGNYYDVIYERLFRDEVIDFLKEDTPKLFKSPTEGNIIVRLMDVKLTPNQTLGRLIYSFSATAYEIMENTFENYESLNINIKGEALEKFTTIEYHLGQYILQDWNLLKLDENGNYVANEPNIIEKIYEKYDRSNYNTAGLTYTVTNIYNLSLDFEYKPTIVTNNAGENVLGYNISINNGGSDNLITIYSNMPRRYDIDSDISFDSSGKVIIKTNSMLKSISTTDLESGITTTTSQAITDDVNNTITVIANFIYKVEISNYVEYTTKTQSQTTGIGQIVGCFDANTNLYDIIYNKYFLNWELGTDNQIRYLSGLTWASLEAPPGAIFEIQDASDEDVERHRINYTGLLNLEDLTDNFYNIIYIGMWDGGKEPNPIPCDIVLNYYYELITETY